MRLAAATATASLLWVACSLAGPGRPATLVVGQSFSLQAGQWAQTADRALGVGFEGVTADSRCPKGEQCIRAGHATLRVWLQRGGGPREARELQATAAAADSVHALDHELRLLRLDPHPVSGRVPAAGDYVATLILTRGAAAASER
jgi:hypothetical protein